MSSEIEKRMFVDSVDLEKIGLLKIFLNEIEKFPVLTVEEEISLIQKIQKGDERAKEKFINSNLRLVVFFAGRYNVNEALFLDLVQAGNIGLIRAVDKFDLNRGVRFSTYARWWIYQAIAKAFATQSRIVELPTHRIKEIKILSKTEQELTQELQRDPLIEELSVKSEINIERINYLKKISQKVLSLDISPIEIQGNEVNKEEVDVLKNFIKDDTNLSPLESVEKSQAKERLYKVLKSFTPREIKIISMRFGLGNDVDHTLEEIGQEFNLTRERIRQIEAKILREFKKRLESLNYF